MESNMPHLLVKTTIAAVTLGLFGCFAEANAMPRLLQDGLTSPALSVGYYGHRYGGYGYRHYGHSSYGYRNYGYRYGGYGRGYGYGYGGYGRGCGGYY
jgi:hypothetical protein